MSPGSDRYLVGSEEQKNKKKKTKGTLVFTLIVVIALDYQEVGKKHKTSTFLYILGTCMYGIYFLLLDHLAQDSEICYLLVPLSDKLNNLGAYFKSFRAD